MRWTDAPVVTLSRNGQALTLGRSGRDTVLHLHGSRGLGLAPWSVAKSDRIGGDGSVVRGGRYGDREVFLPVHLSAATVGELTARRRDLYRLLAPHLGPVTVHVHDPVTGTDRSIEGLLKEGLEGDFGEGFTGVNQAIGLSFDCPDPWWSGPDQTVSFRVNPGTKPFLSTSVQFFPVVLAQSVVAGQFEVTVEGDGPVQPVWEVSGPGTDLVISNGTDVLEVGGAFAAGSVTRFDGRLQRITPDRWADVSIRSSIFPLHPGLNALSVTMVGATDDTLIRLVYREKFLEAI